MAEILQKSIKYPGLNDTYVFLQPEDIEIPVTDVKVNGGSIVNDNVANIPLADSSNAGVVKVNSSYGIGISGGLIHAAKATAAAIKAGTDDYQPIVPDNQDSAVFYGLAKAAGDTTQKNSDNNVGNYTSGAKAAIQQMLGVDVFNEASAIAPDYASLTVPITQGTLCTHAGKLYSANSDISSAEDWTAAHWTETNVDLEKVSDVQINGTSIVSSGVANIPVASTNNLGVAKIDDSNGISIGITSALKIMCAQPEQIKAGTNFYKPIVSSTVDAAAFYGLAKAAGDSTQSQSANAVGTYTDNAKAAIQAMLGVGMTRTLVSGSTPSITAASNTMYICGEVSTLSITPPSNGVFSVIFESGSTATVLTLDNSIKCPAWFDPTDLESNMIYELNCNEGLLSVGMWEAT